MASNLAINPIVPDVQVTLEVSPICAVPDTIKVLTPHGILGESPVLDALSVIIFGPNSVAVVILYRT